MSTKILLVDDEENVLAAHTRNLHKRFTVETATGGEEALRMLEEAGPYAILVSDMRMPGMDGITLLERARAAHPDTVRVMLTGNADQATAIEAVNRGAIFRFLTKPCDPATLGGALEAALGQHRLLTAERELLELTLRGAIRMMGELLSLLDPASFGRGKRLGDLAEQVALDLGAPAPWTLGVAATMAQIGVLTLPAGVLQKVHGGAFLSSTEREVCNRIPEIGASLIRNIPRLEEVADIVHCVHRNFNGTGFPEDGRRGADIPLGARILRVVDDFLNMAPGHETPAAAFQELLGRSGCYDPDVVASLQRVLALEAHELAGHLEPVYLPFRAVLVGMKVVEAIETLDGWLVVPEGTVLGPGHLEKLRNFDRLARLREPIRVLAHP
jgi:response regulator RpfG family c-di-GMP phosphodiesterase